MEKMPEFKPKPEIPEVSVEESPDMKAEQQHFKENLEGLAEYNRQVEQASSTKLSKIIDFLNKGENLTIAAALTAALGAEVIFGVDVKQALITGISAGLFSKLSSIR